MIVVMYWGVGMWIWKGFDIFVIVFRKKMVSMVSIGGRIN